MTNITFENYLELNYSDILSEAISNYINENDEPFTFCNYQILDRSYVKIGKIVVKGLSFGKCEGRNITFTAVIEAELIINGLGENIYTADTKYKWYSVTLFCCLASGLRDLQVIDVGEYKSNTSMEVDFSKNLIPYIGRDNLDEVAEKFLLKYYPDALEMPMPLDVYELTDNMCLSMYFAPLPDNVFGMSFFGPAKVKVFEENLLKIFEIDIDVGTILINPKVNFIRNIGSTNNTIVHECLHHELHSNFFELHKLLNDNDTLISCEVVGEIVKEIAPGENVYKWMEWQSNVLAPRILMPTKTIKNKFFEILSRLHSENRGLGKAIILEKAVSELADFYNVSKLLAKLRAVEVGIQQAIGSFVYVDGSYCQPYYFKEGGLKKNQTYVVNEIDAIRATINSSELSEMVCSGMIVYVNAMFCINSSKYVNLLEDGSREMTVSALDNVDECCLVFERLNRSEVHYSEPSGVLYCLYREVNASSFLEAFYNPDYEDNQSVVKRAEEMKKIVAFNKQISDELLNLPSSFSKTLEYHMKRKGLTNEILAERSGLSGRAISDYRNKEFQKKELPTVMALCIGMNLHYLFSEDLISKSGHRLTNSEEHIIFKWLMLHHSDRNIFEWNSLLGEAGISQILPSNRHKSI